MASEPASRAGSHGLHARVLTAAVGAPIVIGAVLLPGGFAFLVLVALCFALAVREALRLLPGGALLRALLAVTYVGLGFGTFAWLRLAPPGSYASLGWVEPGARIVLLLLLTTWAGDTAAYFVGRSLGRHKLAPRISPGKTWEGAAANLATAVGVGALLAGFFGLDAAVGVSVGLVVGVFGQVGDLLESVIKRMAGVKDSGSLFPGHGGMLDRVDALLVSAPLSLLVLWGLSAR